MPGIGIDRVGDDEQTGRRIRAVPHDGPVERGKRFSKCNPTVEITADDYYASFHPVAGSDLCPGDTEWTVTADGETESDVLTVTDE